MTERKSTPADLHRMADKARQLGLTVMAATDGRSGWAVTSHSRPGMLHAVTVAGGCDCEGYGKWGHCSHYAAVLDELNMLPEITDEDPEPPTPAAPALPAPRQTRDELYSCQPWELTQLIARRRFERARATMEGNGNTCADAIAEADEHERMAIMHETWAKENKSSEYWTAAARCWHAAAYSWYDAGEDTRERRAAQMAKQAEGRAAVKAHTRRTYPATAAEAKRDLDQLMARRPHAA